MKNPIVEDRRQKILKCLERRDQPAQTTDVAGEIKETARTALQDLVLLRHKGYVRRNVYQGSARGLGGRRHAVGFCLWELTEKGRERARQRTVHVK